VRIPGAVNRRRGGAKASCHSEGTLDKVSDWHTARRRLSGHSSRLDIHSDDLKGLADLQHGLGDFC
jgi:hypothetical protein